MIQVFHCWAAEEGARHMSLAVMQGPCDMIEELRQIHGFEDQSDTGDLEDPCENREIQCGYA